MRRLALMLLTVVLVPGVVGAQVPEVTHSCVDNCGDGGTSSSADDAARAEAVAAEKAERARIDAENKERARREKYILDIRDANESGVDAFADKRWSLAITRFKKAAQLAPNDSLVQSNLARAELEQNAEAVRRAHEQADRERWEGLQKYRRALEAEQHKRAKFLAAGIVVPPPGTGPDISDAAKNAGFDQSALPVWGDAMRFVEAGIEDFGDRANDEALGHVVGMFDMMTPQGEVIRIGVQEGKLASEAIPRWIMGAAKGELSPDDPITAKAVTMIFNTGSVPGAMLDKIVVAGSAEGAFLDEAQAHARNVISDKVTSLLIGAGASLTKQGDKLSVDAHALVSKGQAAIDAVERWTKRVDAKQ